MVNIWLRFSIRWFILSQLAPLKRLIELGGQIFVFYKLESVQKDPSVVRYWDINVIESSWRWKAFQFGEARAILLLPSPPQLVPAYETLSAENKLGSAANDRSGGEHVTVPFNLSLRKRCRVQQMSGTNRHRDALKRWFRINWAN